MFTTSNLLYILAGDAGWICRCGPRCNLSIVYLYGSLHESYVHERLKTYVCILYCSPCAPLMTPWLGELEGTSLAIAQAKGSPVLAL